VIREGEMGLFHEWWEKQIPISYNEKVSVCIPTYNRAGTISNSIESILKQTYSNIEIIVVDNASTDNTIEIVKGFDEKKVKYRYFAEHLDVNRNFIRSIRCAETEIVCLFHSDDYYYPTIIEEQLKYIKDEKIGAVFSKLVSKKISDDEKINIDSSDCQNNGSFEIVRYDHSSLLEHCLSYGNPICCPTFMTKKSVIHSVGLFDQKEGLISDTSLWLPIARKYDIIDIQKPLMIYGISKDQLGYKIIHKRCDLQPVFTALDNEHIAYGQTVKNNVIKKYMRNKSKECWCVSRNLLSVSRYIDATRCFIKAVTFFIRSKIMYPFA